ncbi:hypothetical protein NMY22_g13723 [Coprinellus aureogranulatus]|nr:hypothetical protein NMY22_g13723 [Coprinellus aureogranulatus]
MFHPTTMSTAKPAPIFTLVDDILLKVFDLLAVKTRNAFHDVMSISQVCTHWRALAISFPELWRRYPLLTSKSSHRIKFKKYMLRRCGTSTLDIGWQSPGTRTLSALETEMEHIRRCRSYSLTCTSAPRFMTAVKKEVARRRGPRLQHLSIQMRDPVSWGLNHAYGLQKFFGNDLPLLQSLQLSDIVIPLPKLHAPMLQALSFVIHPQASYYSPLAANAGIPTPCLFRVVESFPSLTRLKLHMVDALKSARQSQPLLMPKLVELDLSIGVQYTEAFLEGVKMPQCRVIKVDVWDSVGNGDGNLMDMVSRTTSLIVQRLVKTPSFNLGRTALSFLTCFDRVVESVVARDVDSIGNPGAPTSADNVHITITAFEFNRGQVSIIRGVAKGFLPLLDILKSVRLPVEPSMPTEIAAVFREYFQSSSIAIKYPTLQ